MYIVDVIKAIKYGRYCSEAICESFVFNGTKEQIESFKKEFGLERVVSNGTVFTRRIEYTDISRLRHNTPAHLLPANRKGWECAGKDEDGRDVYVPCENTPINKIEEHFNAFGT